jgi:hypothetical protein
MGRGVGVSVSDDLETVRKVVLNSLSGYQAKEALDRIESRLDPDGVTPAFEEGYAYHHEEHCIDMEARLREAEDKWKKCAANFTEAVERYRARGDYDKVKAERDELRKEVNHLRGMLGLGEK